MIIFRSKIQMMKKPGIFLLLLFINFSALIIGTQLIQSPPKSNNWYNSLNQAPWTPPGYVFGIAWTSIMILYTIYWIKPITSKLITKKIAALFIIQWILNIGWNPVFFNYHNTLIGMFIIMLLLISLILAHAELKSKTLTTQTLLILPYLAWLCVAFSLNAFIYFMN